MQKERYALLDTDELITPALVCFEEILLENTRKTIAIAGNAQRLWPHVKTHKCADIVKQMLAMGIERFKCATIAEADMLAQCGARHILLAYPIIGPNAQRWAKLVAAYPAARFYAIADSAEGVDILSALAEEVGASFSLLLDLNMGMNRTGAAMTRAEELYRYACAKPKLILCGLHCYDGHHNTGDIVQRQQQVNASVADIDRLCAALKADGLPCDIRIMGGTPSFPCHAKKAEGYLSPGTCFLWDAGYDKNVPDLPFVAAAVLKTRVVSHPGPGLFTLDLGCKGIASDPPNPRGCLVELPAAVPTLHSEEHWVWALAQGDPLPAIGAMLTVIPTHICPTSALYPAFAVARGNRIVEEWPVTARNRKIVF